MRHAPADLDRIGKALEAMGASFRGGEAPTGADREFHGAVAAASGNPLFAEILGTLRGAIHHSMSVALGPTRIGSAERARRVLEEHEAIRDAIARRDAEGADLAMRYHLSRARQRVTDGHQHA